MILVIDNGSTSLGALVDRLRFLRVNFRVQNHAQRPELTPFSGVIITGRAVASQDSNRDNSKMIQAAASGGIPVLGICYGAEIIATTFGGTLRRLENRLKEWRAVSVIIQNPLLEKDNLQAYESHGYKICRLSSILESVARSAVTDNEAIRHRQLWIYGTQFHPELSGDSGTAIIRNFVQHCEDSPR